MSFVRLGLHVALYARVSLRGWIPSSEEILYNLIHAIQLLYLMSEAVGLNEIKLIKGLFLVP